MVDNEEEQRKLLEHTPWFPDRVRVYKKLPQLPSGILQFSDETIDKLCMRNLCMSKYLICIVTRSVQSPLMRIFLQFILQYQNRTGPGAFDFHFLLHFAPDETSQALSMLNRFENMRYQSEMARLQESLLTKPVAGILDCIDVIHAESFNDVSLQFNPTEKECVLSLEIACLEHFHFLYSKPEKTVAFSQVHRRDKFSELPTGIKAAVLELPERKMSGNQHATSHWLDVKPLFGSTAHMWAIESLSSAEAADYSHLNLDCLMYSRYYRIKGLISFYANLSQVLEKQHYVHQGEVWHSSSCFLGSSGIPHSNAYTHATLGIADDSPISCHDSEANHVNISSLPSDVIERILSYFSFSACVMSMDSASCVRNLRYCITSCKGLANAAKTVILRSMNVVPFSSNYNNSASAGKAAGGAASTDGSLESVAEKALDGLNVSSLTLSQYQLALSNLSLSLVSLGVLHRIIWRARHHNARGNREFSNGNLDKALGHYILVFHDCLARRDLVKWVILVPEDFDLESCIDHDRQMLFTMEKNESLSSSSSMQCEKVSHMSVLDEWDARVLRGQTSRASRELNLIVMQSLTNASLCLMNLGKPAAALPLATWGLHGRPKLYPAQFCNLYCRRGIVYSWRTGEISDVEVECKLQAGTMGKARINQYKSRLCIVQALRALGKIAEAKDLCYKAINSFRRDPAIQNKFRDELARM